MLDTAVDWENYRADALGILAAIRPGRGGRGNIHLCKTFPDLCFLLAITDLYQLHIFEMHNYRYI